MVFWKNCLSFGTISRNTELSTVGDFHVSQQKQLSLLASSLLQREDMAVFAG